MNRHFFIRLSSLFVFLCCALPADAQTSRGDDSARQLESLRREHPRLLFTEDAERSLRDTAKTDLLLQRLIRQNAVNAEAMLTRLSVESSISIPANIVRRQSST